jgi:FkbM family methyltransferase
LVSPKDNNDMTLLSKAVSSMFLHEGRPITFLLPSATDHISKTIISSNAFYERRLLELLASTLKPDNLVVDVGANIGNHTVFFAAVCGCEVEAFEPNPDARVFLEENLRLNSVSERVRVHQVGLADVDGRGEVARKVDDNLGATSYEVSEQGSIELQRLDSFRFKKRISLLKIDAEGMDVQVVRGALGIIGKDRPLLVCEAASREELISLRNALDGLEYVVAGCFNATDTYVVVPARTATEKSRLVVLEASGLVGLQHDVKGLSESLRNTKRSLDKVAMLQRQVADAILAGNSSEDDPTTIGQRVFELRGAVAGISSELREVSGSVGAQQGRLIESLTQLSAFAIASNELASRVEGVSSITGALESSLRAAIPRIDGVEASVGRVGSDAARALALIGDKVMPLIGETQVAIGQAAKDAAAAITGLSERGGQLSAVEAAQERMAAELVDMDSRIGSLAAEIPVFVRQVGELAGGIDGARREINGLNETVLPAIVGQLAELQGGVEEAKAEVRQLSGELLPSVASRVAEVGAALESAKDRLEASVQALDDRFHAMQARLRETGERFDVKVGTLGQRLDAADSRLDAASRNDAELLRKLQEQRAELEALVATARGQAEAMAARVDEIDGRVVEADRRFRALLDGRIFSTLSSIKRAARFVLGPFIGRGHTRPDDQTLLSAALEPHAVLAAGPEAEAIEAPRPVEPARVQARLIEAAAGPDHERPANPGLRVACRQLPLSPPYASRRKTGDENGFLAAVLPSNGLVSVVMTTFNTRDYVQAAVESILAQTYRNLELIVVDDGSSDGTYEKVQELALADPRMRVFASGVNRGTYWCKNVGITKAKGVAITFMDSDDTSDPERIARQYALLSAPGIAVTTCLHERRDLQGNLLVVAGRTRRLAYISQMMRRGVFDLLGYFDTVRTSADDEMLRRIKRFIGEESHKTVHEVLYHAVVREASLTQDPTNRALAAAPGELSVPRKAYSEAVDQWHNTLLNKGRYPFIPFPLVRRPFPIHDKLRVDPERFVDEAVTACVASFPPRREQLRVAVNSLIDQVDLVYVYLNGYDEVPDFLNHPRVVVGIGGQDLRDNGKFKFIPEVPAGYCFTIDDDIAYPKDYVQGLIRKVEMYDRRVAVGIHGTVFAKPFVSYFEGRRVFHFRQSLDRDQLVDQLGTGTLAFHTDLWRPSSDAFRSTGMVDAWIALEAKKSGIPLIAVARRKSWLAPIPDPSGAPPSLFEEFKRDASQQTALIRSVPGWGEPMAGAAGIELRRRIAKFGAPLAAEVADPDKLAFAEPANDVVPSFQRPVFKLAVVGRTDRARWKKGGILKSTHLTADMLRPFGVDVALVDLETGDPAGLAGFPADIVMIYPGDPERPDFKDVIALVDHHAELGRIVLVNLSLNGRPSRKEFICRQMDYWRSRFGRRVVMMTFGDRVEDDPALASIVDLLVAIPKTLEYPDSPELRFDQREGIFLGDFGKLCDQSLLAWPVEECIEKLHAAIPEARLFCVQQYRPKKHRDLGLEVLPFLESDYSTVLSRSRLMVSLVKYATFEMVPMELAALGVPVLHPKMDNSLSDYLGLAAIEAKDPDHLAFNAALLYRDPMTWGRLSLAGRFVAKGLAWENMASQMYLRLLFLFKEHKPNG